MKAFIYTGGKIFAENITDRPSEGDLIIAADSGYLGACEMSELPSVVVGDFDSLDGNNLHFDEGVRVVRLPAEKDLSDTQAALDIALENGADDIVIVGGLDGRLDHTLANLLIVEELAKKGISAIITDGKNRVRCLKNSSVIIFKEHFKYLSVIPIDDTVRGVTIKGCKYALDGAKLLKRTSSFAISNEIVENCALVSVGHGSAFVIESQDKL